jgi:hypothetical protein
MYNGLITPNYFESIVHVSGGLLWSFLLLLIFTSYNVSILKSEHMPKTSVLIDQILVLRASTYSQFYKQHF